MPTTARIAPIEISSPFVTRTTPSILSPLTRVPLRAPCAGIISQPCCCFVVALRLLPFVVMQGLIRCVLVAGTLLGCGPGGVGPQDDTQVSDAPLGPSGLVIEWSSSPADWPSNEN